MPEEIILSADDERALEAAWRKRDRRPRQPTPLPRHPGEPSPPDDDEDDEPRRHMRVPAGTPGAQEKKDSLGRHYFDLPGTEPPGEAEQSPAQTTPHPGRRVAPATPEGQRTLAPQDAQRLDAESEEASRQPVRTPGDRREAAMSLHGSRAVHMGRTGDKSGLNASWIVTLSDGNKGIFKPGAGEKQSHEGRLAGIEPGTFWRREIAASRLAELVGMADLVPVTVERQEGSSRGSMQQYVGDASEACDVDDEQRFDGHEDAARAAAFDYLIGNMDRHQGNWMVTDGGKLALIDNGTSFPNQYDPDGFFHVQIRQHAAQSRLPVPDLGADRWDEIEGALAESGVEPEAVKLTRGRYRQLLTHKGKPFADLPLLARERGLHHESR